MQTQAESTSQVTSDAQMGCPYHSAQKTTPSNRRDGDTVERDANGVWQIRGFDAARAVLRSPNVKQAGFQAESLDKGPTLNRPPMLFLEGPEHHAMRKQTARFFTPKAVKTYDGMIEQFVDEMLVDLKASGSMDLSDLTMKLAVRVAAEVVGLTNSDIDGMAQRIEAFFDLDVIDPDAPWSLDKIKSILSGQYYTLRFFMRDVRPAIKAREAQRQDDLISHLLDQEYKSLDILTECVTFGAAGMVTTREFIAVAAWHFLRNESLRNDYLAANQDTRFEILHEILRLEPVVGNLLRRTVAPLELVVNGETTVIPAGELIDVSIYAANEDTSVLGTPVDTVCPHRDLPRNVQSYAMSFGDGAHRCPGAYIAIEETDIFLTRFLQMDGLKLQQEPTVGWSDVVKGYEIRNLVVSVG